MGSGKLENGSTNKQQFSIGNEPECHYMGHTGWNRRAYRLICMFTEALRENINIAKYSTISYVHLVSVDPGFL